MPDEKIHIVAELIGRVDGTDERGHLQAFPWTVTIKADVIPDDGQPPRSPSVTLDMPQAPQRLEAVAQQVLSALHRLLAPVDPTTVPDPRRWGTVLRTGERVYWDASYAARRENAWTNVERTKRFSPDQIRADAQIPPRRTP